MSMYMHRGMQRIVGERAREVQYFKRVVRVFRIT